MRVGAPFNPYRVFQGVFAPFWLLEHRIISTGAKLCYVRLLGFAGKNARCYPSLEKLGKGLGVSGRQARDYVKELERAGLISVEQRGLRRTNIYLFLWTAELDTLCNSVSDSPDDPDEGPECPGEPQPDSKPSSGLDRNNCSALDRNSSSALDRNSSSGLERNYPSGPIGINSEGINSLESSSFSPSENREAERMTMTTSETNAAPDMIASLDTSDPTKNAAQAIAGWATERGIQRLRTDRRLGFPEKAQLKQWAIICAQRGIHNPRHVFAVFDVARAAADRSGEWRHWNFLTIQVQLAAERFQVDEPRSAWESETPHPKIPEEELLTEWAKAKGQIRSQIPEIPFLNWFDGTRQIGRCGTRILVEVPDESTRSFLDSEYAAVARGAVSSFGIHEVCYVVRDTNYQGWVSPLADTG